MTLSPPYEHLAKTQGSILAKLLLTQKLLPDSDPQADVWIVALVTRIGFWALFFWLQQRLDDALQQAKTRGLSLHRHRTIRVACLLGNLELDSPYLYDRRTKRGERPLGDLFGWYGDGRTDAVEQALSDFGIHDSFAQAKQRFERHYVTRLGDSAPRQATLAAAKSAGVFLEFKLDQMAQPYALPPAERPGTASELLVQSDGCFLRTGRLVPANQALALGHTQGASETEMARLAQRVKQGATHCRIQIWREAHSGLVRRKTQKEPSVLARRCSRNQAVSDLWKLSCSHGLDFESKVLAIGDGGNGLKEGFEEYFARVEYLLDWRHLEVEHFQETAKAMGMEEHLGRRWARVKMERVAKGEAMEVLGEVQSLHEQMKSKAGAQAPPGEERVGKLVKYIEKYIYCMEYDRWREEGWPIGSSEVESLHKRLIQKRMKVTGACWREEHLDPMLALRTMAMNPGWWQEFWEWEIERRETQRQARVAA